jgi:hypothetical protein
MIQNIAVKNIGNRLYLTLQVGNIFVTLRIENTVMIIRHYYTNNYPIHRSKRQHFLVIECVLRHGGVESPEISPEQ